VGGRELLLKFIKYLIKCTHVTKGKPLLLILDGHANRTSFEATELARKSGIVMLTPTPHTTHKLQVLGVSIFGCFKNHMVQKMDVWMTNHPGVRIRNYDVASGCISQPSDV
jgi:hypothetical protein